MSSKVFSAAIIGLDCEVVEVEADNSPHGQPGIHIVGLPDKAVDESKSRVYSAVRNAGLDFPRGNVTVNLAPADLKKVGTYYDLPIAVCCLDQSSEINLATWRENSLFVGELALNGDLRPVNGVLSIALMCQRKNIRNIFLPRANAAEAALVGDLAVYPLDNLRQLHQHLKGLQLIDQFVGENILDQVVDNSGFDMSFIKGQEQAKRALEIAAAGGHNILMSGPPGSGKTMLARAMASILPQLTIEESLEVTKIHSAAGTLPKGQPLINSRPFRSPHHTASAVALVGGGSWPRPGEISLAHRGVLFLDEFLEFPKTVLENLRQPLEDGLVTVSRAAGTIKFPAKFILVAAMNPCPCGYLSDPDKDCLCSPRQIINYQKRASGPLLDRIDIHIEVPRLNFDKLESGQPGESSAVIRRRVQDARDIQLKRFQADNIISNAEISSQQIEKYCRLDDSGRQLLRQAVDKFHLSARSFHRILKLSRTIADLAEQENILTEHLAESLQYRPKID